MKVRLIIGFLTLFILGNLNAQEQNINEKSVYVKGNALFIPIGIVNLALEHQLSKKNYRAGRRFYFSLEIV